MNEENIKDLAWDLMAVVMAGSIFTQDGQKDIQMEMECVIRDTMQQFGFHQETALNPQ